MLLRASGATSGEDYDVGAVTHGGTTAGIPHSDLLVAFAEAVLGNNAEQLVNARDTLIAELGHAAVVDTAAVIATFNAIDRVADACGIPIEEAKETAYADLGGDLDIETFRADRV